MKLNVRNKQDVEYAMRYHFHDKDVITGRVFSGVTCDQSSFILSTTGERCNVTVADEVEFVDRH